MILDFLSKLLGYFKSSELEGSLYPQQGYRGKAEVEIRKRGNVFSVELELKHSNLSDGSLCEFFVQGHKLGALQLNGGFGKTRFETQDSNLTSLLKVGAEVTVQVEGEVVYRGALQYD